MNHFSRSVRLCVVLNRNGVQFREISSWMSREMEKKKKNGTQQIVICIRFSNLMSESLNF